MDGTLRAALQRTLDRWQRFAPCAGSNVSVVDAALGSWHGASGLADVDAGTPMPRAARCYVYSITKTFIAARVLQLVERGALGLDEPLVGRLPECGCAPEVTVRRLLNHTAGVPSYTDLPDYGAAVAASPGEPWSLDPVIERCCRAPQDFAPGTGWRYSNTGYALLHRLIETITGASFAENVRAHVAAPLGLDATAAATAVGKSTGAVVADRTGGGSGRATAGASADTAAIVVGKAVSTDGATGDGRRLTPGYDRELHGSDEPLDIVPLYHPYWCLTGLVASTTEDIARFYARLLAGELISPASLDAMRTAVPCAPDDDGTDHPPHPFFRRPAYGLGLMIDERWPHGGLYGHGGDGPGFNTWAMHLPGFHGHALTIVAFCNTSMPGHPFRLCRLLVDALERAGPI